MSAALPHCGDRCALEWLAEHWWTMVGTVRALAATYGRERSDPRLASITDGEAREALKANKGDIWAAVTETVEQRQTKVARNFAGLKN